MNRDRHLDIFSKDLVSGLVKEYGSPLLVLREEVICDRYKELCEALERYFEEWEIAYSFKTNYIPGLITVLKDLGASAEVVSGFEYWLAKELKFQPSKIVFNGPDKSLSDIQHALNSQAKLNVGNWGEIQKIVTSNKIHREVNIGIRVNTNLSTFSHKRLGFNIENGEIFEVISYLKKELPHVHVIGLHAHLGSVNLNPQDYKKLSQLVAKCASDIKEKWGHPIEHINLGGGFAVPGVRGRKGVIWSVPTIEEYIENIASGIDEIFHTKKPALAIEPGRFLVEEAGTLITTVVDSKFVEISEDSTNKKSFMKSMLKRLSSDSKKIQLITIDSHTKSILKTMSEVEHLKIIAKNDPESLVDSIVAGNSCLMYDYFTKNLKLPNVSPGDNILFANAGAYTISTASSFIHPTPCVVLLKRNGEHVCVRKKQSFENIAESIHY